MSVNNIIDSPELRKIKGVLENIKQYDIIFTKHFQKRALQREGVDISTITHYLNSPGKLRRVDSSRGAYKIWFKESNKYSMTAVLMIKKQRLIIKTAYKTNRKCQKSITIKAK